MGCSSNETVKGVCFLRKALLPLVKCIGWVRKKTVAFVTSDAGSYCGWEM
jgi:hypothetical protein